MRLVSRNVDGGVASAVGAIFLVVTCAISIACARDQVSTTAAAAGPLSSKKLELIYGDRTWHWKDGAGYFQLKDRRFKAWVGEGAKGSYAEGSWSMNNQGRLCFRAVWHSLRGGRRATTCFAHRSDDKTIYQRRLPKGKWYVFAHIPSLADDEINKLQAGDQVSAQYQANKRYVAAHSRKRR